MLGRLRFVVVLASGASYRVTLIERWEGGDWLWSVEGIGQGTADTRAHALDAVFLRLASV